MPTDPLSPVEWTIVIPVKPAHTGKSRLAASRAHRPGPDRTLLARAIALDTIAAAVGAGRVIVVTDDAETAVQARRTGADAIAEGGRRGLDAAVAHGIAAAEAATPHTHRAALLGDLPALRTEDLIAALAAAAEVERGVVADAEGTGSTLVTARAGVPWHCAFGAGSFARHLALGCVALDVPSESTVRRDVDTADQLRSAARLGLGAHTAHALAL